ncbi:MAG: APC family permease [Chloroflexi bacterium]|nr:APC family permease [Chloroflexota bacterium]
MSDDPPAGEPSPDPAPDDSAPRAAPAAPAAAVGPPDTAPRRLAPELRIGEVRRGAKPGTRYVRVTRAAERTVVRTGDQRYSATLRAEEAHSALSRLWQRFRYWLLGRPLATSRAIEERLSKVKALAIFSSDALSSSAYATEEILLALVLAGTGFLHVALPVAVAIAVLLGVVVLSYRQTVHAYPQGGGTYSVARENLGRWPGLIGGAALLTDYVLTVAVSVSAGVLAITSALPELADYRVQLAVGGVMVMSAVNLRGVREAGTVFAAPTYLFIAAFGAMLVTGVVRLLTGDIAGATLATSVAPRHDVEAAQAMGLFLVLRAFSSGATALTGVEAIANGVQAFKPPESRNAAATMVWMAVILGTFFVGATFLAVRFGIVPTEEESVISQVGRLAFGGENVLYYALQAATATILVLAANTAFNGFPLLASILARDEYLPRQFAFRGDRLAYSFGIVVLGVIAVALLIAFQADTHRLIPLYAIGVFVAFTLSQSGMVRRGRRVRARGWQRAVVINAFGAVVTGAAALVIAYTKFVLGAWIVLVLIPLLVFGLYSINRHYAFVRRRLALPSGAIVPRLRQPSDRPVIVPVGEINLAVVRAVAFATEISSNVIALHVVIDEQSDTSDVEAEWEARFPHVPLAILDSPYRTFQAPFMAYIDALNVPDDVPLTVVLPEFVAVHWWQGYLHNRAAARLREALRHRSNTVVVSVTQQLEDEHTAPDT